MPPTCLNCRRPLTDKFCAHCGQEAKEIKRPFLFLIKDALSSVFELDGRAVRTVLLLFSKPGFLSSEYCKGRRTSYTPPLRLFLVISISFFLLVSTFNSLQSMSSAIGNQASTATAPGTVAIESDDGNGVEQVLELINDFGIPFLSDQRNENLRRYMRGQAEANLNEMQADPAGFFYGALDYITIFMLLMMPILAVIQKLLYFTSHRFYIEHLILTLHNHAFLILAIFLVNLLGVIEALDIYLLSTLLNFIGVAIGFWIFLYLFFSLKNFFQQGYTITVLKFSITAVLYTVVTTVGVFYFAAILFFLF